MEKVFAVLHFFKERRKIKESRDAITTTNNNMRENVRKDMRVTVFPRVSWEWNVEVTGKAQMLAAVSAHLQLSRERCKAWLPSEIFSFIGFIF